MSAPSNGPHGLASPAQPIPGMPIFARFLDGGSGAAPSNRLFEADALALYRGILEAFARLVEQGAAPGPILDQYAKVLDGLSFQRIMNRKECARFLGVSERSLDRYVRDWGLPFAWRRLQVTTRPQRIFLLEDVLEWQHRQLLRSAS